MVGKDDDSNVILMTPMKITFVLKTAEGYHRCV